MNKKWENPKLEQMSFENTECGGWRYLYQCSNAMLNGDKPGCGTSFFSYANSGDFPC